MGINTSSFVDFCLMDFIEDIDIYNRYINRYEFQELQQQLAKSQEVILVHQMGKVGSSSVVYTLKNSSLNHPITHTHFLNSKKLKMQIEKNIQSRNGVIKRHLIESLLLLDSLKKDKKKINIVTIVREPIGRNISTFFETISDKLAHNYYLKRNKSEITINYLIEEFLNKSYHEAPLTWFNREIKNVFGIDIYKQAFDFNKGYKIYTENNINILVLKLENIKHSHSSAFKDFLGLDNFSLINRNIADKKDYSTIYNEFKKQIVLPEHYIKMMYDSKFTKHFYTKHEISILKKKWSSK